MQSSCLNHYECVNHLLHKQYHQGTVRQHVSCGLTGAWVSFRRGGGTSVRVKQIHLLLQCGLCNVLDFWDEYAQAVFFTLNPEVQEKEEDVNEAHVAYTMWGYHEKVASFSSGFVSHATDNHLLLFVTLVSIQSSSCNVCTCIWGGKDLLSSLLESYLLL